MSEGKTSTPTERWQPDQKGTTGIEPVTCGSAIRCSTAELSTRLSTKPNGLTRGSNPRIGYDRNRRIWLLLRWNPSAYRAEAQHTERRLFRSSLKGTFAHLHTTLNKSRDEKLFHTGAKAVNASGVLFLLRLETMERTECKILCVAVKVCVYCLVPV